MPVITIFVDSVHKDGRIESYHAGLTLKEARDVLATVVADYDAELAGQGEHDHVHDAGERPRTESVPVAPVDR